MPVEVIDVMQRQHIDIQLHRIDREEMTCAVEVGTAVGKARSILDHHSRIKHIFSLTPADRLAQGLQAIESARSISTVNNYAVGGNRDTVSFVSSIAIGSSEPYIPFRRCFADYGWAEARKSLNISGKKLSVDKLCTVGNHKTSRGSEAEVTPSTCKHRTRQWHYVVVGFDSRSVCTRCSNRQNKRIEEFFHKYSKTYPYRMIHASYGMDMW